MTAAWVKRGKCNIRLRTPCLFYISTQIFSDSHAIPHSSGPATSAEFRKNCKLISRRSPLCHTLESMVQLHGTQSPLVGKQHRHCDKSCPKLVRFMFFMSNRGFYGLQSIEQQFLVNFICVHWNQQRLVLIAAQKQKFSTAEEHQPGSIEKRDAGHMLHLQDNIETRGFYPWPATGYNSVQNRCAFWDKLQNSRHIESKGRVWIASRNGSLSNTAHERKMAGHIVQIPASVRTLCN